MSEYVRYFDTTKQVNRALFESDSAVLPRPGDIITYTNDATDYSLWSELDKENQEYLTTREFVVDRVEHKYRRYSLTSCCSTVYVYIRPIAK